VSLSITAGPLYKVTQTVQYDTYSSIISQDTRSQAVARIADRTASQHLWGSRDVIGHVTI